MCAREHVILTTLRCLSSWQSHRPVVSRRSDGSQTVTWIFHTNSVLHHERLQGGLFPMDSNLSHNVLATLSTIYARMRARELFEGLSLFAWKDIYDLVFPV